MRDTFQRILEALSKLFLGIFVKEKVELPPSPPSPPPHPPPAPPPTPPPAPPPHPPPAPPPPTRTRPYIMRDSTNGFDIPQGTEMVAGYVDGLYAWSPAMWAFHRDAYQLTICVNPYHNLGQILDVETGDATPAEAPRWVLMRRAAGHDPWVYMNAYTWPQVRQAFLHDRIPEPHYWVARWGPDHTIPPGAIALQYANPTITGRHYDESIVRADWRPSQR